MIRISDNTLKLLSELGDSEAKQALQKIDRIVSGKSVFSYEPAAFWHPGFAVWVESKNYRFRHPIA